MKWRNHRTKLWVFIIFVIFIVMITTIACAGLNSLHEGKYKVGEDIPAGKYMIKCEVASEIYESYKDMMDGLSDMSKYTGGIYKFFGTLAEEPEVSVRVLGSFGEELKTFKFLSGDSKEIILSEGDTLEINGDRCRCSLNLLVDSDTSSSNEGNNNDLSVISWGMSKEDVVRVMGYKGIERSDNKRGTILIYPDQEFDGFSGAALAYYFKGNQLYYTDYSWAGDQGKVYTGLRPDLLLEYGIIDNSLDNRVKYFELLYGVTYSNSERASALKSLRDLGPNLRITIWLTNNGPVFLANQTNDSDAVTLLSFASPVSIGGSPDFAVSDGTTNVKDGSKIAGPVNRIVLSGENNSDNNSFIEQDEHKSKADKSKGNADDPENDNEYKGEILFRGIPWGSDFATAQSLLSGMSFSSDSWFPPYPRTLHFMHPWFPQLQFEIASADTQYYDYDPGIKVAGYDVDDVYLYFAKCPGENGVIDLNKPILSLHAAEYKIHISGSGMAVEAAADLKRKLSDIYGPVYKTEVKTEKWTDEVTYYYLWKGKNSTYVSLITETEDSMFHMADFSIYYIWGEGDELLKRADEIIKAQIEANATPAPYETDDKDGL